MLAAVKLNGALVKGYLIDSGSLFSMVTSATLSSLLERPSVKQFVLRPPNIIDVGRSSVRVLCYVDAIVIISGVEVRHPLIVVEELAYPLLIGIDVLRPHCAIFELGTLYVVRLKLDRCLVCVE